MRFLLSALFLTLAACSSGGDTDSNTDSNAEATSGGDNDSIVGYWQANKYEHTKNLPVVVSQIWEEAGTHYIDHEMNDSPIKQSIDDSDALTLSENGLFSTTHPGAVHEFTTTNDGNTLQLLRNGRDGGTYTRIDKERAEEITAILEECDEITQRYTMAVSVIPHDRTAEEHWEQNHEAIVRDVELASSGEYSELCKLDRHVVMPQSSSESQPL